MPSTAIAARHQGVRETFPDLRPLGDTALTVRFGSGIEPAIHARVLGFARALAARRSEFPGLVEWLPAFDSVSVFFDPAQGDAQSAAAALLALARASGGKLRPGTIWPLPPACARFIPGRARAAGT